MRGNKVTLLAFDNLARPLYESDIHNYCHEIIPIHRDDIELQQHSRARQLMDMAIGAWHGYPRHVWQFHSPDMLKVFTNLIRCNRYDIIHFSEIGVSELLCIKPDYPVAKVYDLIDAVSLLVRNSLRYRMDITWPIRTIESFQLRSYERKILDEVDAAYVVSERDKAFLGNRNHLYVIGIGLEIPEINQDIKKVYDLLFVGNMSMRANIDAVLWFVKFVWPEVLSRRPETTLYIVGMNPDPKVQSLASERIIVTGKVEDVGWYYQRAKVFVAPIRYGSGQKIKLIEACAHGLPVVTTHEANEGLGAPDGTSILLVDKPEDMVNTILNLLTDAQNRLILGKNAHNFVRDNFSWERSTDLLLETYSQAIKHAHSHAQAQN